MIRLHSYQPQVPLSPRQRRHAIMMPESLCFESSDVVGGSVSPWSDISESGQATEIDSSAVDRSAMRLKVVVIVAECDLSCEAGRARIVARLPTVRLPTCLLLTALGVVFCCAVDFDSFSVW